MLVSRLSAPRPGSQDLRLLGNPMSGDRTWQPGVCSPHSTCPQVSRGQPCCPAAGPNRLLGNPMPGDRTWHPEDCVKHHQHPEDMSLSCSSPPGPSQHNLPSHPASMTDGVQEEIQCRAVLVMASNTGYSFRKSIILSARDTRTERRTVLHAYV